MTGLIKELREAHALFKKCGVDGVAGAKVVKEAADEIERLRTALDRLRKSATLLQLNMEGCVANHYSKDFEIHGMPGWLVDARADIEAALKALADMGQEWDAAPEGQAND